MSSVKLFHLQRWKNVTPILQRSGKDNGSLFNVIILSIFSVLWWKFISHLMSFKDRQKAHIPYFGKKRKKKNFFTYSTPFCNGMPINTVLKLSMERAMACRHILTLCSNQFWFDSASKQWKFFLGLLQSSRNQCYRPPY